MRTRSEAAGVYGRNYIFCRQDTFSASKTLASRGYLKTLLHPSFARQWRREEGWGSRASPKGSNPSGSHARVLVPVYKMNTWKLEPRFYTRTRVFGHECTRARGRNRKPRSSRITTEQYAPSLFHLGPPSMARRHTTPSGHTCGQHKRNIHEQSSISWTMPVIWKKQWEFTLVFPLALSLRR